MNLKDLESRIDSLIIQAQTALRNVLQGGEYSVPRMRPEEWSALRASGLSFIESTFGRQHSFFVEFDRASKDSYESSGKFSLGVLTAIQQQVKNGWIETTRGLVTSEVFADFLEMADHLLEQRYKDAAAVMAGSVLEEHLRQLCISASVPVEETTSGRPRPRKADTLNADLARANKYSILDQKQVTAWLDLRNKAAHGKYGEFGEQQVALLVAGVRDFISRNRP